MNEQEKQHRRSMVLDQVQSRGGLEPSVAREVSRDTGVAEAEVYGAASFFHLLSEPDVELRVCTGLSCQLEGAEEVLAAAGESGMKVSGCSCLAACDQPPAVLVDRRVYPSVDLIKVRSGRAGLDPSSAENWTGNVGPASSPDTPLAIDLLGEQDSSGSAFRRAVEIGAEAVIGEIEKSGLQGRGGAGFPAHIKWKGVRSQAEKVRYVVLNADEGEPGTFKDREVLTRRADLVLEGLAIAARTVGAADVYLYLRGEFGALWSAVEGAIEQARTGALFPGVTFHMHAGHGAYICGEETALIEALEGKRGMPRLRPPFPVEKGLWNKPTLVHNVETIACVPGILTQGGQRFRDLGREEPGTKLYCVSGHVERPGTYELPLGVSLDELVAVAGGYVGELKAFSPGGASSGFLPASERTRPLSFKALAEVGSMLGSGGVVVLNSTVNMATAVAHQLRFFEDESCGQCAPCRIGTRYLHDALDGHRQGRNAGGPVLARAADVAWQMNEGSICGLGQAAALPLTTALKYFPEDLE